jgi:hypothetical protein
MLQKCDTKRIIDENRGSNQISLHIEIDIQTSLHYIVHPTGLH